MRRIKALHLKLFFFPIALINIPLVLAWSYHQQLANMNKRPGDSPEPATKAAIGGSVQVNGRRSGQLGDFGDASHAANEP